MQANKLKPLIAGVLVLILLAAIWVKYGSQPQDTVALNTSAPKAPVSQTKTDMPKEIRMHQLQKQNAILRNPFSDKVGSLTSTVYSDKDYRHLNVSILGKSADGISFVRVNGRILHEGDVIRGYKILSIRNKGITLKRPGEQKHFVRIF